MLRIPNLRRTLSAIALSAPLAVSGCIGECPQAPTEDVIIGNMPDAELAPLVASCKQTQSCEPLCNKVYEREYGSTPDQFEVCELTVSEANEDMVRFKRFDQCIGGRRPNGYRPARVAGPVVAAYLAEQAALEAASVRAFSDLHDDLLALGAPTRLLRAVIAAAADEVRHATACDELALRYGGSSERRMVAAAPRRSRHQLAIDNLVEGCVRETYGAVVAGYQARAATDPVVRAAMTVIARDEAKHAALSWKLHGWLWPQLSLEERTAALAAAAAARAELVGCGEPDAELRGTVGLPDAIAAASMLAQLDATVWTSIA